MTAGVRVSTISAFASALRAAAMSWPSIERSVAMSVCGPGKTRRRAARAELGGEAVLAELAHRQVGDVAGDQDPAAAQESRFRAELRIGPLRGELRPVVQPAAARTTGAR